MTNAATEILDKLMQTAKAALPESVGNDVKENLKSAIQDVLSDLDVVSKEEFEVQAQVLSKTRSKVDQMEVLIAELEKKLDK